MEHAIRYEIHTRIKEDRACIRRCTTIQSAIVSGISAKTDVAWESMRIRAPSSAARAVTITIRVERSGQVEVVAPNAAPPQRIATLVQPALRLNWRIIQATPKPIDYVIAHELTHLIHTNPGSDFWATIGQVMPDYEQRRDAPRKVGAGLFGRELLYVARRTSGQPT